MTTTQKAREFRDSWQVLKEGENLCNYEGIAVIYDESKFLFNEYAFCIKKRLIGTIELKDIVKVIIDELNSDIALLEFKKKAESIVGDQTYKLDNEAFGILQIIPTIVQIFRRCKKNNIDPREMFKTVNEICEGFLNRRI